MPQVYDSTKELTFSVIQQYKLGVRSHEISPVCKFTPVGAGKIASGFLRSTLLLNSAHFGSLQDGCADPGGYGF